MAKIDERWDKAKTELVEAAHTVGIDAGVMAKIARFESGFNPDAKPVARDASKNTVTQFDGTKAISSAHGYGQFLNGTWKEMIQNHGEKYGVENAKNLSDNQIKGLRTNTKLQAAMLAEFTKENIVKGQKLGGPDPDANVYAFHNLGAGDAEKVLKALSKTPDVRVDSVLSAKVISGNPSLYGNGSISVTKAYENMGTVMKQGNTYALEAQAMQKNLDPNFKPAVQPVKVQDKAPSATLGSSQHNAVLRKGDKGDLVLSMQEALVKQGAKIKPDGIFGPDTEKAVKEFQEKNNLKVDGVAGKATHGKLEELNLEKVPEKIQKESENKSFFDKLSGVSDELKALYHKVEGYLRPALEGANVGQKHADAMIATGVQKSVEKNITASEVVHAGIDKGKNLISVFSDKDHKYACFDAIAASKNNPEQVLAAAQQQLEQPQQQLVQQQERERERTGPAIA